MEGSPKGLAATIRIPVRLRAGLHELIRRGSDALARHTGALRLVGVLGILLFNFWAGMSPHWDYPYPLHVDEWFALGYAQSTLDAGALQYASPYKEASISYHPEMGLHLLLGSLKSITGLSWLDLYRPAPGVLLALLALLTYAFGRRVGFGWAAALFVPLIPTSIRTLGPAFVVPVSEAMLFIVVTLLLLRTLDERSRGRSLWILLVLVGGTLFVHPPTEVVVTALAAMYLASLMAEALTRRQYRRGASLALATGVRMLIPMVVLGVWLPSTTRFVVTEAIAGTGGYVLHDLGGAVTGFPSAFGAAAVVLSAIGLFLFILRSQFDLLGYVLPGFTILLALFLIILFPNYELGPNIIYERGWSYLGLLLAIFAGYATAFYFRQLPAIARALATPFGRQPKDWMVVPLWCGGVALLLLVLTTGLLTNRSREAYAGYYHVIDNIARADFAWIGQHVPEGQTIALAEPSVAWAYPPIGGSGSRVHGAVASPYSTPDADAIRAMVSSNQVDVQWLKERSVSILYSGGVELTSGELFKVRQGVYFAPEAPDTQSLAPTPN